MNREEVEKILTHGEWFYFELFRFNLNFIVKPIAIVYPNKYEFAIGVQFICYIPNNHIKNSMDYKGANLYIEYSDIKKLRPATQEEVLKYFPDEVLPEPISPRKRPITRNKKQYILR